MELALILGLAWSLGLAWNLGLALSLGLGSRRNCMGVRHCGGGGAGRLLFGGGARRVAGLVAGESLDWGGEYPMFSSPSGEKGGESGSIWLLGEYEGRRGPPDRKESESYL